MKKKYTRFTDLSNSVRGKLHILDRIEDEGNVVMYNTWCECSPDKIFEIPHNDLTKKCKRTCGCSKKRFDLVGKRFGKLIVQSLHFKDKKTGNNWFCLCDCGNTRIVRSNYLNKGVVSCHKCSVRADLTGRCIGQLRVLSPAEDLVSDSGITYMQWNCVCSCGNSVIRRSNALQGKRKSACDDCNKANNKAKSWSGYKDIRGMYWNNIIITAKDRNIEFLVSMEYCWEIFIQQNKLCALSGIELVFADTRQDYINGKNTASLDRIDSSKGYIEGNVQWVHKWVNTAKSDMSQEEFVLMCTDVANFNKERYEYEINNQNIRWQESLRKYYQRNSI